jgi:hypothetical protein
MADAITGASVVLNPVKMGRLRKKGSWVRLGPLPLGGCQAFKNYLGLLDIKQRLVVVIAQVV